MKSLPWIFLGAGVLGIGAVLVLKKQKSPFPPSPLKPEVKAKVKQEIATSTDANYLKRLATGLQKSGAVDDAMSALKKVADLTGVAQVLPAVTPSDVNTAISSIPGIAVSPSPVSDIPTKYKVVSGDIPGAIATRFGLALSVLAKANGDKQKRIMAGQIQTGETLNLPPHTIDKGPINHAKGIVS